MAVKWKKVVTEVTTGNIEVNTTGTAAGLSRPLEPAQGGLGKDVTDHADFNNSGLVVYQSPADGVIGGFSVISGNDGDVLSYDDSGVLGFSPPEEWITDLEGVYAQASGNVTLGNVTVNGELTIGDGLIIWGGESIESDASILVLNADQTEAASNGSHFGLKAEAEQTINPYLVYEHDNTATEARWKIHQGGTGVANDIALLGRGAGEPSGTGLVGVGSLYLNTTNSDLYVQVEAAS